MTFYPVLLIVHHCWTFLQVCPGLIKLVDEFNAHLTQTRKNLGNGILQPEIASRFQLPKQLQKIYIISPAANVEQGV